MKHKKIKSSLQDLVEAEPFIHIYIYIYMHPGPGSWGVVYCTTRCHQITQSRPLKDGFKNQNHELLAPGLTKRKWKSELHSGINHDASTVHSVHTHTSLPETETAKR